MRIDDENKVVWCNKELLDWKNGFTESLISKSEMMYKISRIGWGYGLENVAGEEVDIGACFGLGFEETKMALVKAVIDDYTFKLEQPQKYYWRKKKEHLAWFEDLESVLVMSKNNDVLRFGDISSYDNRFFKAKFTETEARELLKDDFDKFEKVEIDE